MVHNGNPHQNGWFGDTPIFGNTHVAWGTGESSPFPARRWRRQCQSMAHQLWSAWIFCSHLRRFERQGNLVNGRFKFICYIIAECDVVSLRLDGSSLLMVVFCSTIFFLFVCLFVLFCLVWFGLVWFGLFVCLFVCLAGWFVCLFISSFDFTILVYFWLNRFGSISEVYEFRNFLFWTQGVALRRCQLMRDFCSWAEAGTNAGTVTAAAGEVLYLSSFQWELRWQNLDISYKTGTKKTSFDKVLVNSFSNFWKRLPGQPSPAGCQSKMQQVYAWPLDLRSPRASFDFAESINGIRCLDLQVEVARFLRNGGFAI